MAGEISMSETSLQELCQQLRIDQGPAASDHANTGNRQRISSESPFAEPPSSSGGDVTSDNSSSEQSATDAHQLQAPGVSHSALQCAQQHQQLLQQDYGRCSLDGQQKSSQICFDYTKGLCTRGDKCKYSHDLATIVHFNSKEKGICFDYLRNQCHRGLLCRFSHDLSNIAQQCQASDVRPAPAVRIPRPKEPEPEPEVVTVTPQDPSQAGCGDPLAGKGKTTAICYDFVKGVCQRGSDCRYSHDLSLIARTARGGQQTQKSGEICYDYLRGRCNRGTSCKYSHNISFLATPAFLSGALNSNGGAGNGGGSTGGGPHSGSGTPALSLNGSMSMGGLPPSVHQRLASSVSAADPLARAASSTSPGSLQAALTSSLSTSISPDLDGMHPLNASLSQDLPDVPNHPDGPGSWNMRPGMGQQGVAHAHAMAAAQRRVAAAAAAQQLSNYNQLQQAAQMVHAAHMAQMMPHGERPGGPVGAAMTAASGFAAATAQQQAIASSLAVAQQHAAARAYIQQQAEGTGPGSLHRAQSAPLGALHLHGVPGVADSLNALLANLGENPQLLADTLSGLAAAAHAAQAQVNSALRVSAPGMANTQGGPSMQAPGHSQPQPIPGRYDPRNGVPSPPPGSYHQHHDTGGHSYPSGVHMLAPSASVPGPDHLSRAASNLASSLNMATISPDLLPLLKEIWNK